MIYLKIIFIKRMSKILLFRCHLIIKNSLKIANHNIQKNPVWFMNENCHLGIISARNTNRFWRSWFEMQNCRKMIPFAILLRVVLKCFVTSHSHNLPSFTSTWSWVRIHSYTHQEESMRRVHTTNCCELSRYLFL